MRVHLSPHHADHAGRGWGPDRADVDEETGAVTFSDDDFAGYGVVDEIARRVMLTGGDVLGVRKDDVPDGSPVAAILRYPP